MPNGSKKSFSDEDFINAVSLHLSKRAVLQHLGLVASGANYKMFNSLVMKLQLDTKHFTGQGHLRGKKCGWTVKIPLETILVEHSTYTNSSSLKNRLINEKKLRNQCYECDLTSWCNKHIVLQLDHINGKHNDHRIENLRLLCPNCHSQTVNFAGRNKGKYSGNVDQLVESGHSK